MRQRYKFGDLDYLVPVGLGDDRLAEVIEFSDSNREEAAAEELAHTLGALRDHGYEVPDASKIGEEE